MAKAARFRQSNLRRRRAFMEQRAVFLLICEERNSEPLYFSSLGRTLKATVIESIKAAGSPDAIADKAIEEARSRGFFSRSGRKQRVARGDQIWAVFDPDQHEHFDAAVMTCEKNGIKVARSNPCFEIWLILHVEEFHRPDGREVVFHHFCKLRPDYQEGKGRRCDFATLIQSVEVAEGRAAKQLIAREEEGLPFGPPSTTVHHLTETLRARG